MCHFKRAHRRFLAGLERHEVRIRSFIEEHLVDETGLLYSHLNVETLKPWTNAQLASFDVKNLHHPGRGDPAAVFAYEDTLMATGEYAVSQMDRFRVTGDPSALGAASHAVFAILRVLYEGELHEVGYLPKPHGGMRRAAYSHEISPDQHIKSMAALRAFEEFAPPSLRRTIEKYLVAIINYYIVRDFKHLRRERMVVTVENRPHVLSVIVPGLVLAGRITGDKKFLEMLKRFDPVLDEMAEGKLLQFDFNICSLYMEGFHLAMSEGRQDPRLPVIMKRLWEGSSALVAEDGYGYWDDERDWKTSRVIRVASYAPIVAQRCPGGDPWPVAFRILKGITDPKNMRYLCAGRGAPNSQKTFSVDRRIYCGSICETSVASWLTAYWRIRSWFARRQ